MLFLWISSHSIVAREFPIRPSQRKSNQGIYNNVKYVDVNFILPCTDNAEGPVYNEMSYFRLFFFFRKLHADISYYFEFIASNLRQIVMLRVT